MDKKSNYRSKGSYNYKKPNDKRNQIIGRNYKKPNERTGSSK